MGPSPGGQGGRVDAVLFETNSAPVDDTDTARIASDLEAAKHLGLIQLRFFTGVDIGHTMAQRPDSTIPTSTSELAEKSLKGKAISHGTS